jgi:hypothetical protein
MRNSSGSLSIILHTSGSSSFESSFALTVANAILSLNMKTKKLKTAPIINAGISFDFPPIK